jgi:ribosomal protein S18 acetylase RimI-like enzyme
MKIKKLKLEVFSENERAINLYKKFKFKQTDVKEINNKEVICMELDYHEIIR